MKKVFIISSILLAIVLFFLGIYNLAFRQDPTRVGTVEKEETANNEQKTTTGSGVQKISAITDDAVRASVLTQDQKYIRYYAKDTGIAYEIDLDGRAKRALSDRMLPDIVDIVWSPDATKVLSTLRTDTGTATYVYDYTTTSGTKIKEGIDIARWANVGNRILYKYFDSARQERSLSVADADGGNWKKLVDIPFQKVSFVHVPHSSRVAFWNFPNGFEETLLQMVTITGGDTAARMRGLFGADYRWSPDGARVLVSSTMERGGTKITLATMNSDGGEYQNLTIPTLASKSAWSYDNTTVYYALPNAIPEGSVMPNDYLSAQFFTRDTFWKVNTKTGKKERLVSLEEIGGEYDAIDLFLSPTENALFFTNRIDDKLYRITF